MVGLRQNRLHRLLGAEREVEDVGQVPGAEPGVDHLGRHTQLQVVTLRVDDLDGNGTGVIGNGEGRGGHTHYLGGQLVERWQSLADQAVGMVHTAH